MIVYVTTADHDYTVKKLLEYRRTALHGGLITMAYAEFTSWAKLPHATYILADLDRLTEDERARVTQRCDALDKHTPCTRLNDPRRSLDRWQLLQTLYREGINPQRVQRADRDLNSLRFPVFVRSEHGHGGSLGDLLETRDALHAELRRLVHSDQWQRNQLWVVEFFDVRNELGLYEKYGFFRIGEQYFACELSLNKRWVCKGEHDSEQTATAVAREARFLNANPHIDVIRPIFELAGIEYGRIDYAFHGDRLMVFEINTNPMLDSESAQPAIWQDAVRNINQQYVQALSTLGLQRQSPYYLRVADSAGNDRIVGGSLFRRVSRHVLRRCRALEYEHDIVRIRNRFKRWRKPRRARGCDNN